MKRNLFLLLFAIVTLSTFAQTTSEHLTLWEKAQKGEKLNKIEPLK